MTLTQYHAAQKRPQRAQRCLRVQAHFSDTWSWLVHFQTAQNQVSKQTNGNGWSSPGNPRMECFWENISALVPAFMQTVVLHWPMLYFSGKLTLPWYSTERKRLFFVWAIYWYFMRQKENYIWEKRSSSFLTVSIFFPVLLANSIFRLIALEGAQIIRALGLKVYSETFLRRSLTCIALPASLQPSLCRPISITSDMLLKVLQ